MTNRFNQAAADLSLEIANLQAMANRFSVHPTLFTRVPHINAEIERLQKKLPTLRATAKWSAELKENGSVAF